MHDADLKNVDQNHGEFIPTLNTYVKKNLSNLVPLAGLVFIVAFFAITTGGLSVQPNNLVMLLNQSVIIAVIATGATFIFTMGAFDISLGAATCMSAVLGALILNATGSVLMMIVGCIASAILVSLVNGLCIALFKLPSFIVTLATMNIISAGVQLILGTSNILTLNQDILYLDTFGVKLSVLFLMLLLSAVAFYFMKLGRGNKIIGGSQTVAKLSGISIFRNTFKAFLISGIGIGLGAFLLLARTGSVSSQTASSFGFDVIVAIVLGGMPISGGAKSKIFAAVIGAFTITALNNGLVIMNVPNPYLQAVKGLLFLTVVTIMVIKFRGKLLPR